MEFTACTRFPTHHATLEMLGAAVEMAETVGQPQCIVIVDASGELLGEVRMTGAKFLSPQIGMGEGTDGSFDWCSEYRRPRGSASAYRGRNRR